MLNILLNGSNGNMGKAFTNYIKNSNQYNLQYAIDKQNFYLFNEIINKPDVIIDFSTPKSTFNSLNYAVENLVPIVIATTGFSSEDESKIKEFSEAIPIFKSSNLSYGINILSNIAALIAQKYDNVDIEILEKHHRNKIDAPSGTALMIANKIKKSTKKNYEYVFDKKHISDIPKKYNEIGFSSIRGGNLFGEHSVMFFSDNETIEITHKAYSRNIYIEGALKAAQFIIDKKNGLFDMKDLISF